MKKRTIVAMLVTALFCTQPLQTVLAEQPSTEESTESVQIDSGALFDQVCKSWENVIITDFQNGTCDIELQGLSNNADDAKRFLWAAAQIMSNSDISKEYERFSFSSLGEGFLAYINISDYVSNADFRSVMFCTGWSQLTSTYNDVLYNFDYQTINNRKFNEITGSGTAEVTEKNNDFWWLFSHFPVDTLYKFNEQFAVVNFRTGYANDHDSGYRFAKLFRNALFGISNFRDAAGGLSFDSLDATCFDIDGNKLFGCAVTISEDGSWDTKALNYYASDFEQGFRDGDKNE